MVIRKPVTSFKIFTKMFSGQSLTQKAYLNALAALLDYGTRLAVAFVVNPLLVAGLGDYFYGVWQISRRLAGYLSIGGGRPTQALKWTMAQQQTSTDYAKKRRAVASAVAVWALFLPVLALAGGILVWFAPTLLRAPAEFAWLVRLAVGLLVIDLLITDLADVPQSVLRGENLGYQRMGLSALLLCLGGGLTVAALYAGFGLAGVATVELSMTVLTGLFFLLVTRRYVPWFGLSKPSLGDVRQFFSLSGWFIGWRLVQQAMMASDIVVLGLLDSVTIVTIYSLTKFGPDALTNLLVTMVGGILPGLGGVIGAGELEKARRVYSLIMRATWLVITVAGVITLLWSQPFVDLWVGEQYYAGALPTLLIVLMGAQLTLIRNDANLINLTLDLPRKVLVGTVSVVLALGLAGVLIRFFGLGINGLCLGFIAGRAILSIGYPWSLSRFFGVSFATQLKAALRPAIVTVLLFGLAFALRNVWHIESWLALLCAVGATFGVTAVVALYAGLSSVQREEIWSRIRKLVR